MEVGAPGDVWYAAVCQDGEHIATLCETDGGLVVCASSPSALRGQIASPRCARTAGVVCNEDSALGPRLDYPVCLDDSEPSCEL